MLRIGKRTYRFSKEVEEELSKIGIYITSEGKECRQYCNKDLQVFVYANKEYPSIQIQHFMNQYNSSLKDFVRTIDNIKELAIKIYKIVMQDYPDITEEVKDHG